MKRLKQHIQAWNKESFGNIFEQVVKREDEIWLAENRVLGGVSEELRSELHLARDRLRNVLYLEELFWKQKARGEMAT